MNLTKELVTKEIPFLHPNDTGETTLSLMEEYKVSHLPLVDDGKYLCLVSERDAYRMESLDNPLGKAWFFSPALKDNGHLFDAVARMSSNNLSLIPVVGENNEYLGVITQNKIIERLSTLLGTDVAGSVVVLEIPSQEYSVSEIARIVESNNARIINILSYPTTNGNIHVAIKMDQEDASAVIRSFERFNYKLVYSFMHTGVIDDTAQKRLEELFYYINM
jgi:CBS domain-containing protein